MASRPGGPGRSGLFFPLLSIGFASLLFQVASARWILAGLRGNELALGLVLGSWLLLTGLGTALGVWLSRVGLAPASPQRLSSVLRLLPAGLLASLLLQQRLLPAFAPGQVVGPLRALLLSLLCLAPACLTLGVAFGVISALRPRGMTTARWASRLFVLESAGTVVAGLLFHFAVARASLAVAALVAAAGCWLAAVPLVRGRGARTGRATAGLGGLALLYLALSVAVPMRLPGAEPSPSGYEILERRSSPHAVPTVARRGDQVLVVSNGVLLFTNQDHQQAEADIHLTLLAHPAPRRVLMIGGGLGGGLAEALKHPVERIDYAEIDAEVIALARRRGGGEVRRALSDGRVRVLVSDGRALLATRDRYDVILVGVPGPSSALHNRYYTVEFFRQAMAALRPGGLVRVALAGKESLTLDSRMARIHASVRAAMQAAFGHAVILPGARTLLLSSRAGQAPDLRLPTLAGRLRARRVQTRFLGQAELSDRTFALKHEHYLARLSRTPPLENTDLNPAVYFSEALSWLAPTTPGLARWLESAADRVRAYPWLPALALLGIGAAWGLGRRRGKAPAGMAMAAAGLSGLTVELALLLCAQTARGIVYHEMGALLAAFMAGLAVGAPPGRWLTSRAPGRALQLTSGALALVCASCAATMGFAVVHPGAALPLLLCQMVATGAAVGAVYPAASDALARGAERSETAPGRAYAWDLAGAAVGAVLAAGIALPVLGLRGACLTCAALCLGVSVGAARPGAAPGR